MSDERLFKVVLSVDELNIIRVALLDSAFVESTLHNHDDVPMEMLQLITKLTLRTDFEEV